MSLDFTTFHNIIAGQPRSAATVHAGVSPLTRAKLWDVPVATAQDVDDAVAAATAASRGWATVPYTERTRLLGEFADLYLQHAEEFVELLMAETGRSRQTAAIEVYWAAEWLRYPAKYTLPETKHEDDELVAITKYEPLGVVAAICPWNFPISLAMGKIAPAIATGNTIIVKPSPFTPYTTLKLIHLAQRIFPPGILQALSGDDTLGPLLVHHPRIQKISFTGSTATGQKIMRGCAETMKRFTLETGGNNVGIVFPDVDVAATAAKIAGGLWFNAGQVCINARRLYVHSSVYGEFVRVLGDVTQKMAGGVGPVQNEMQFEKVQAVLRECRELGLRFVAGGEEGKKGGEEQGLFVRPVVLDNPPDEAGVLQEEVFGPVVSCKPFDTADEVVGIVNEGTTGLSAIVWTADAELAERVSAQLDVGNVFVNGPPKPNAYVPFGGHKQSGVGVEYGLEGLLGFCQVKSVHVYK
ncbi:aldehyde dehydrogenase [Aspergillus fijiensis CBS 313.89]|uniref:aldehyde dehydrogenase (NAD(+)) n=1 Tax=Aspergillus fijiensis CBS 313.89 TaxID=1448319 RepID=A0A8G1W364_9EURO|nr:aldehyde dehydrogenase [Aspergillus fijiensis CBS 313.89]RAK81408.1 aldehyde dehydrogenase [Aspergillus fijiensis CBS 313.89]